LRLVGGAEAAAIPTGNLRRRHETHIHQSTVRGDLDLVDGDVLRGDSAGLKLSPWAAAT
jgi:hypothetical protein